MKLFNNIKDKYFNKLSGEKDPEETCMLTGNDFDADVCCFCNELVHLDNDVFCSGCPNISHLSCYNQNQTNDSSNANQTNDSVEVSNENIKTFKCPQCKSQNNQLSNLNKNQTDISFSTLFKQSKIKREFIGPAKNRRCTDVSAIFVLITFLACFITVLFCLGGFEALTQGTDSCGNICGQLNALPPEYLRHNHGCMGADHTDKKFVMFVNYLHELSDVASSPRECVSVCPRNMYTIFNYCMHFGMAPSTDALPQLDSNQVSDPEEELSRLNELSKNSEWDDITTSEMKYLANTDYSSGDFIRILLQLRAMNWFTCERIVKLVALAVVMSYVIVIIFSCVPSYAVWSVPISMAIIFIMGTAYFVVNMIYNGFDSYGWIAVFFICLLILNIYRFNKTSLKAMGINYTFIAVFYSKAGLVLTSLPTLLLISILTMTCVLGVVVAWFRGALWIESAYAIHSPVRHSKTLQVTAQWMWSLFSVWAVEFILNCQRMVIAGAISLWFFKKNDDKMAYFVLLRSFYNLIRYHLGTVVFGSVIFHPLPFFKYLFKTLFKCRQITKRDLQKVYAVLLEFLLKFTPDLLVCWFNVTSSQAFNETALHGKGYCMSLSRSVNMQANHYGPSLTVRRFSICFTAVMKIFVVLSTTMLSFYLFGWTGQYASNMDFDNENFLVIFVAIIVISYLTGHFFLSAYMMIVEALFVCQCEAVDSRLELTTLYVNDILDKQTCVLKLLEEVNAKSNAATISTDVNSTPPIIETSNISTETDNNSTDNNSDEAVLQISTDSESTTPVNLESSKLLTETKNEPNLKEIQE